MDQFARKQQLIDQRAVESIASYPLLWAQMITEWRQPGPEDRAWLLYSANYLCRTTNVRWAIDPMRLVHRLPGAPEMPASDLEGLSFILLTHRHGDHFDLDLLRQLKDNPVLWVIPAPLLDLVGAGLDLPGDRVVVPLAMQTFEIQGICITPFDGLHWEGQPEAETLRGVPATGYLVEFNGKRWLFPGDTRTYDASRLPVFGPVDGIFAHLWLGRSAALLPDPPLLDEFCRFCIELLPSRIVLTHLDEFGRDANDFWDRGHAQKVISRFQTIIPEIDLSFACLGENIPV